MATRQTLSDSQRRQHATTALRNANEDERSASKKQPLEKTAELRAAVFSVHAERHLCCQSADVKQQSNEGVRRRLDCQLK
jgi:hypothetical protein